MIDNSFPWGICIGEFRIDAQNIKRMFQKKGYALKDFDAHIKSEVVPCMIKSEDRGFCVLYNKEAEEKANDFIESIVLLLIGALPIGMLQVDLFSFGKKRFLFLDALRQINILHNAYTAKLASKRFEELEELVQERQFNYLDYDTPTISDYNEKNDSHENFHILLINLEDFLDEYLSQKRLRNFFDVAYEAGVYTILFGSKSIAKAKEPKSLQILLERFKQIKIDEKSINISQVFDKEVSLLNKGSEVPFEIQKLTFDKKSFLESLHEEQQAKEEKSVEQNFLHIPIGKKGRDIVYFDFGLRSGVYSAFVAGMTGMGKSNLLNVLITRIAQQYTAKEIELFLMDYNEGGLEFAKYKRHPNTRRLFLNLRDQQPALDMLRKFVDEMASRANLFNKVEVSSIEHYNKQYPQDRIAYKILIIDEVQDMFSGKWNEQDTFNALLKQIAKKGRKYGLHFILATQSLESINIDKSVIGQIGASISFRLRSEADGMKIFDEKEAYSKATKLEKYHFVYHTLTQTTVAKADFIEPETIPNLLEEVRKTRNPDELLTPIVVSGYEKSEQTEESSETETESKQDEEAGREKEHDGNERMQELDKYLKKLEKINEENPGIFEVEDNRE